MRKYFVVMVAGAVIAAGLIPATAAAQEPSRGEVFGGFQWIYDSDEGDSINMIGAVAEGTGYVNDWFGISGEVGWARDQLFEGVNLSGLSFAGGPRFRFANDSIVTPSLRALVGAWRLELSGFGMSESQTELATFFGGAVDIRASDRISVRVQPDFIVLWIDDSTETVFRLAAGVVVGF